MPRPNPDHPEWGTLFWPRELAAMNYQAGWTNAQKLLESISVEIAESNGYEHRLHENLDPDTGLVISRDRGLWMINDVAHPDCPDSVAFDAVKATTYARKLYDNHGQSFNSWAAYNNGSYKDPNKSAMRLAFDAVANFLRVKNGYPV